MKNKKIIFIVLAVLIIIAILATVIVKKNANGGKKKETENIESFETQDMSVNIGKVATAGKYLIVEYDVEMKDVENTLFSDATDYIDGFDYKVQRELRIDGSKILSVDDENQQIAYKKSDTQARIYDVVHLSNVNLNDNYNLEVNFFDFGLSEATVKDEDTDEESDDITDGDEQTIVSNSGLEEIGTLKLNLNKVETDKEATLVENTSSYDQDNITMRAECEIQMASAKFLIVNTETKATEEDYTRQEFDINVQDEKGNTLDVNKAQDIVFNTEDESSMKLQVKTIFAFIGENKDLKNVKLQAYIYNIENNNDSKNKTWYSLENQVYTGSNSYNGNVKVTRIEIDDATVSFYFTRTGFVPAEDQIILARNSKNQTEYIVPDKLEKIATNQYVATFYVLSIADDDEEKDEFATSSLLGTKNAEFTIFENKPSKIFGEGFTVEI